MNVILEVNFESLRLFCATRYADELNDSIGAYKEAVSSSSFKDDVDTAKRTLYEHYPFYGSDGVG
jgi:hypothetical protein